jgi:hypothetical protein
MSFFDDALGAMGQSLAQSASGYIQGVTGPVVGGMLGSLFGGGQASGGAEITQLQRDITAKFAGDKQDLDLLTGQMQAQSAQLASIGNELTGLSGAVSALTAEVEDMSALLEKIAQVQAYASWQAVDNQMINAITGIHTIYETYAVTAANFKTVPATEVLNLAAEALDPNDGPAVSMAMINSYIAPTGRQEGALQLWSQMVAPLVASGLLDYRTAVEQYTAYYKKLVSAQLLAASVLVEGHNYYDDKLASTPWADYQTMVLSQEDEFIHWLMPLVYSGVEAYGAVTGAPGDARGPEFTWYEAAMQLHPGLQAMPGDGGGQGYYATTSIFADAEAMLASLVITEPGDRRIVVHMTFSDDQQGTFKVPIDAATITIEPPKDFDAARTGPGGPVAPTHTARFSYTPFPAPFNPLGTPDENFFNGNYLYLYRHVYAQVAGSTPAGTLPDGPYQLTDLNGELMAVATYASVDEGLGTAHFQETKVLDYTLTVSPTSRFDFMNFGAYMISQLANGTPAGGRH